MGRFRGVVPGKLEEGGFMRILPPDLPGKNEPFFFGAAFPSRSKGFRLGHPTLTLCYFLIDRAITFNLLYKATGKLKKNSKRKCHNEFFFFLSLTGQSIHIKLSILSRFNPTLYKSVLKFHALA